MTEPQTGAAELPNLRQIMRSLPHRFPFLMIDKVIEWEPGKRVVCLKNVSFNEPHFMGHFPENPIMPGVLITEALAQAGVFLVSAEESEGKVPVLTGIDEAKFRKQVRPGDQLRLELELERYRRGFMKYRAKATVDGELAAEMLISCAMVDPVKAGGEAS